MPSGHSTRGLGAQLARQIEQFIALAPLAPGTPLIERALAARFSVSRSPVREALRHTLVAAIGPVTAASLRRRGIEPQLTPAAGYFLKPLTAALQRALGRARP
jgi:DNA-binding FadR family transcriptional regulator